MSKSAKLVMAILSVIAIALFVYNSDAIEKILKMVNRGVGVLGGRNGS